jgi:transglutaminase-like putative cysteine protease
MARQPDAPAGRQRLVGVVAVAALAAATSIAFGRVFVGHAPTRELVLAAAASVALAAAFERRSLALSLLVSAAGLAVAIAWIVLPQTTWYGVPTLHTVRAVGRSLDFIAQQARVQVAPTPAFAPLMLAAVTATWTAAFSTYALAIRAGSPLLAVMPCVALVAFADTVLEDGARPAYAIVFLLAVLGVVFVDGVRRVREWGPVWSSSSRAERGFARVASRGAQAVAVVAVLAAVLAPGVLPGFRASALVDFSTSGDDGIDLDPFVSIQNQLQQQDAVDLFDVTAAGQGSYWRLYSLDTFDGTTWSSTDPQASKGQPLETPARLQSTFPPTAAPLAQQVHVLTDIDDPWLPMAFPPETLTVPTSDTLRYDADLGTAVLSGGLDAGLEYNVSSRVVDPTPEELSLIRFSAPSEYGRYTVLPDGLDPRLGEVAKRWTEGASTPYAQVMAIQDHFRDGSYEYNTDVQPVADADALLNFIANTKSGFCQQYATAMAVLVRELGYPARVAVGFRQGTHEGDRFTVTSKDAHAWVEVDFPGYGWLPFEPTPTKTNPLAQPGTYLNPTTAPDGSTTGSRSDPQDVTGAGRGSNPECTEGASKIGVLRQLCNADHQLSRRGREAGGGDLPPNFFPAAATADDPTGYSIPYRWIGLALGVLVLLVLLITPVAKWIWRRRLLRGSNEPRELVLAAYRVFDGEAADLGLGRRNGETLDEHRARLAAAAALSDGHLARLTALVTRAAYSAEAPTRDEARAAVRDARTAAADLRRDTPFVRRVLGTYRPGL